MTVRKEIWDPPKSEPRRPKPADVLFEFEHGDDCWRCELHDQGARGIEAQFLKNGQFSHAFRWPTRELAADWAEQERRDIERQ